MKLDLHSHAFFKATWKPLLALVAIPFLVYIKSLWFEFSPLDEDWMILKNGDFLSKWKSILTVFTEPFNVLYYRPMNFVTFIVDYHSGGYEPFFYHLTNIGLHILNVVLIYFLLAHYQVQKPISFLIVLIFAIHPSVLGCVVWVPGRNDSLLTVFFIASILAQNKYLKTNTLVYVILLFVLFLCALFTKESAIVFPFIYLANGFVLNYKIKSVVYKCTLPTLLISAVWFLARTNIVGSIPPQNSDLFHHIINASKAYLIYIGKIVLPIEQSVFPTIENSIWIPGIVVFFIFSALIFKAPFQNKKVAYFGLFIFVSLLALPIWFMSESITREQYENRLYPALLGIIVFVSQIKWNEFKNISKWLFVLVFSGSIVLTAVRMQYYSSPFKFLQQSSEDNPNNYFFQFRLADYYLNLNEYQKAVEHYSNAIKIQPQKGVFYNNRANAYKALGNKEKSIQDFDSALVKSNFDAGVQINKCMALLEFNEVHLAAIELFKIKACCQDKLPKDVEQAVKNKWRQVVFAPLVEKINAEPNNAELYSKRAKLFFDIGIYNEAIKDLNKAISLNPEEAKYKKYLDYVIQVSIAK